MNLGSVPAQCRWLLEEETIFRQGDLYTDDYGTLYFSLRLAGCLEYERPQWPVALALGS